MDNSLQKIDHNFPENIDESINNFRKKTIPSTKEKIIKILSQTGLKIYNNKDSLLFSINKNIELQIKNSLDLGEKKIFGIKFNKKLDSYNRNSIIKSFKEKLKTVPYYDKNNNNKNDKDNMNMDFFKLINNLALYLSSSGTFITSQEYKEMDKIIKSKGTGFSMGVLQPELCGNIDKNTHSTKSRGKKYIRISPNLPQMIGIKKNNNEDMPTLKKLSEAFIQDGNQKLLPGIDETTKLDLDNIEDNRKQIIKNESKKFKGYYSIGGKIHFEKSIDLEEINEFQNKFGFGSTCFQLIHANTSLNLPPSCSPNILLFYILALEKFGLISGEPDLQLGIPGRLPNRAAGILGSAVLLSGDTHTEYSQDAFSTTHDSDTGARIMAYDGGVLNNKFKHNSSNLKGRTDMLGIVDLNSTFTYHFLGSIISQTFYGGKYSKTGKEFIKEYVAILNKYNLEWILKEERIYDKANDNNISSQQHYELIKTITDLQKDNRETFLSTKSKDGLIVFEIKNLLNKYKEKLKYK